MTLQIPLGLSDGEAALGVPFGELSELLTCELANVECLLRHRGAPSVLTALGGELFLGGNARTGFQFRHTASDVSIRAWTGLRLERRDFASLEAALGYVEGLIAEGEPVLVHADVAGVFWNPYFKQQSHAHAFVVDGARGAAGAELHVVDAYTNQTPHGSATPTAAWFARQRLLDSLEPIEGVFGVSRLIEDGTPAAFHRSSARDLVRSNIARCGAPSEQAGVEELLGHLRQSQPGAELAKAHALAAWLGFRARGLHHAWWQRELLPSFGEPEGLPAAEAVLLAGASAAREWGRAQTMAYIAYRRVLGGQGAPLGMADSFVNAVRADREWLASMGRWLEP